MDRLSDFLQEAVSRGKKKDPYIDGIAMGISFHDFLVYVNRIGIETKEDRIFPYKVYHKLILDGWFGLLIRDMKFSDTVVVELLTGANLVYALNFVHHTLSSIEVFKLPSPNEWDGFSGLKQVHSNKTTQETIADIEHRIERWQHKKH